MTEMLTGLNPRLGKVAIRICTEFHEMPGMRLTEAQVRRLWSLSARDCEEALDYLCASCQLPHEPSGCYLLSFEMREKATLSTQGGSHR